MLSDLLPAIREVDEVIHLRKEILVAGLCNWWGSTGSMRCDLLSNPIVAEKTPQCVGLKVPFQAKTEI
jgi:hypothetical protein